MTFRARCVHAIVYQNENAKFDIQENKLSSVQIERIDEQDAMNEDTEELNSGKENFDDAEVTKGKRGYVRLGRKVVNENR